MIRAVPHIRRMAPYALAELETAAGERLISLSQNESLRGPSPKAVEAATGALRTGMLYPDPDWTDLRHALASLHDIDADGIVCGTGSLDLIGCLARVFCGPTRAALAPEHAYPFFRTATQMANARFDTAAEVTETVCVDALLAAVRPDTGLVFVANPGNPTGTRIPKRDLLRLRENLRKDVLLVVDEAYGEFADDADQHCFDMVASGGTAILRTFSKAYAMAGFRVGWGLFPTGIAAQLRKVTNPNNVSAATQAAASAALTDQDYMRETCAETIALRDNAIRALQGAGFEVRESHTNFILIILPSEGTARSLDQFLRGKGIILRRQGAAGLPHALRMTVGPRDDLGTAVETLICWKEGGET